MYVHFGEPGPQLTHSHGSGVRNGRIATPKGSWGPVGTRLGEAGNRSPSLVPPRELVGKRFIPVVPELPSVESPRIAVSAPGSPGTNDAGPPPLPVGNSRTGQRRLLGQRTHGKLLQYAEARTRASTTLLEPPGSHRRSNHLSRPVQPRQTSFTAGRHESDPFRG